jgi:hypothetical protein
LPAAPDPALRTRLATRGALIVWLPLLALLAGAVLPFSGSAQEPTPRPPARPDTIRGDTLRVPIPPEGVVRDTLPRDTLRTRVPDTLRPPPHIPRFPEPGPTGWAEARWEWTREELLRYQNLSLLELLERVPGLVATRAGGPGAPAGTAAFGQAGGRMRVFRDGFELDPLGVATLDLQQIGVVDLDLVRVERTLAETRVHLRTFQLEDMRPFSEIEVGTGNFQARFLRAMFVRPAFANSVVTAAFDLSNAGGYRVVEPSSFTSARLRWDVPLGVASGLQLEYVQGAASRERSVFPMDFDRRELVLRGRTRIGTRLHAEALVGRASHDPARGVDPLTGRPVPIDAATDTLDLPASSTQFRVRSLLELGIGYVEGSALARVGAERGFSGPGTELGARAGLHPAGWLGAEGEARTMTTAAGSATALQATVRTGPVLGLTLFGNVSAGERWVTLREDVRTVLPDSVTEAGDTLRRVAFDASFTDVRAGAGGARLGAELGGSRLRLAGALVRSSPTTVVPFGLGFDRGMPATSVGAANGVEGRASLALPGILEGLTLDGWYVHWNDRGNRPYLPAGQGLAAAAFTGVYLDGQFEPYARLAGSFRGRTPVPGENGTTMVELAPYTMLDFALQLRILDVRAFFLWENILNELEAQAVPGRLLPSTRTLYGIRWFFRN